MADDRGPELLVISWVFTGLALVTVALKVFYRAHVLKLGWDDFFILFSLLLITICTSVFTYDVHLGMGKRPEHILPPEQISTVIKVNLIGNPFGIMAYSFPNISVAILVNQLLPPNKLRAGLLYGLSISQCVIAGISCVLLFTQCLPAESLWDQTVPPTTCLPEGTVSRYSYFVGAYTAFTDVVLGVVPCLAFWKLKLPTRTKVGLCICMACTLFAAVCAAVKTSKLWQLDDLANFTHGTVDLVIWAIVEANVIIIAACMPTMRPFFHKTFQKAGSTFGHSKKAQYGSQYGLSSYPHSKGGSLSSGSTPSQSRPSYSHAPPPPMPHHPKAPHPIASQFGTLSPTQHSTHVVGYPAGSPTLRPSNDSQNAILRTTDISASYEDRAGTRWPLGNHRV